MNNLQIRQQETRLAETNEAKVLLPILAEYSQLYAGQIQNAPIKKQNILMLANELAKIKINDRPAIEVATPTSIREVALRVITEDIDLSKKQANIIAYGNDITLQKQFYGNVALAKQQYGNHIEFYSQLVYPGDDFEIIKNGLGYGRDEFRHTTTPDNLVVKSKDGYKSQATPIFVYTYVVDLITDKVIATNVFSYERCYNSWTQSGIKPTHKKFPGEMMIKTNESYIATRLYNKSNTDNDNPLQDEYEGPENEIIVEDFIETPKIEKVVKPKKVVVKQPTIEVAIPNKVDGEINEEDIFNYELNEDPQYIEDPTANEEETLEEFVERKQPKKQPQNQINTFLDDNEDFEEEVVGEAKQPSILHVLYRDFIGIYKPKGYRLVPGSYNQQDKSCDIQL